MTTALIEPARKVARSGRLVTITFADWTRVIDNGTIFELAPEPCPHATGSGVASSPWKHHVVE